jgi:hypothetical protein
MNQQSDKRPIWQFPWGYRESFIISAGLLVTGFILEYFSSGRITQLPSWPLNLLLFILFAAYLVVTHFFVKGPVMNWLSSVPAALASITTFTILVLLMGFIPQGQPSGFAGKIGFNHIHASKPYIITAVFMLTVLGFTILKRLKQKMTWKNFAFLLNHAGLFLIITSASIGSSDLLRLQMPVNVGKASDIAFPDDKHQAKMPFTIHLHSFIKEEYPPELIIYDGKTGFPVIPKGSKLPFIEEGEKGKILGYDFEILTFLPYSVPVEEAFITTDQYGSTHSALVSISKGQFSDAQWISCGNFMYRPRYFILNDQHILGMAVPKSKRYASVVDIESNGIFTAKNTEIIVNKPLKTGRWKIYQSGYDGELGRWSERSIFEVIRDPWLPVVYTGIFMMLLGSVYLLWVGRKL